MTKEEIMRRVIEMARQNLLAGHQRVTPIISIIARNGDIVGEGCNTALADHDPTAHAEVMALRAAAAAVSNYRLPGSTLYATMEPCPMCAGAIVQARVARVVYAARDERWGAVESVFEILGSRRLNHHVNCEGGLLAEESARRLKDFFAVRR